MKTTPKFITPDMSRLTRENSSFAQNLSGVLRRNLESLYLDMKPGTYQFPVNATAPSVKDGHGKTYYTANTAGTVYTDFVDAEEGQRITIIALDGNTSISDGGNFSLSAAWSPSSGDTLELVFKGGTWYEASPSGATIATNKANIATNVTDIATNAAAIAALVTGKVIQVKVAIDGTRYQETDSIPWDVSVPQDSEGREIETVSITPTSASNYLLVIGFVNMNVNSPATVIAALFDDQDATANAIGADAARSATANEGKNLMPVAWYQASNTNATIISMRVGTPATSTWEVSGTDGAAYLNGAWKYGIIVFEIDPS